MDVLGVTNEKPGSLRMVVIDPAGCLTFYSKDRVYSRKKNTHLSVVVERTVGASTPDVAERQIYLKIQTLAYVCPMITHGPHGTYMSHSKQLEQKDDKCGVTLKENRAVKWPTWTVGMCYAASLGS